MKSLVGMRFGKLEVIKESNERSKDRQKIYICKCDCGNFSSVRSGDLKNGNTKSCGCTHIKAKGLYFHPLYKRVTKAYERTHAEGKDYHKSYLKKHIKFGFESKIDMFNYLLPVWEDALKENKCDMNLQIDRIDNSKGYEPGNLRIVTRKINNRNRDITLRVNVKNIKTGEEFKNVILAEFCEGRNLNYKTLHARYKKKVMKPRDGWIVY